MRTKLKNIMTGAVIERTFSPTEKFEEAQIERREMQYLYNDGEFYYFMDTETYEQIPLSYDKVEEAMKYIKENMIVTVKFYKGEAFSVEPPTFVELEVIDTEPGVRGDTVTGGSKPATVETGAVIQVPLFINVGDKIKIDTRTGEYIERV
ncbi:elongation factor P [Caldanaerobacter subterraneus subsp. pacificus DSM 12653]|uniref:Elongation factor P n=1 Tax=Caldanaerobacter subterraneus subsp. pacificus DSM 12653 TaxID=391606 RepID=A0A0F5PMD4_9THEO|nr:elongation factor P [Caldanaerobacter subterraneus subsp. pacificus DSM 12653]